MVKACAFQAVRSGSSHAGTLRERATTATTVSEETWQARTTIVQKLLKVLQLLLAVLGVGAINVILVVVDLLLRRVSVLDRFLDSSRCHRSLAVCS